MKKNLHYKLQISVLLTLGGVVPVSSLISNLADKSMYSVTSQDRERFGEYIEYFFTNNHQTSGRPIKLDISDPIAIVMQDMEENTKKYIVDAINDLEEICPNLDYRIYDSPNTMLNTINFTMKSVDRPVGGTTYFTFNISKAEIVYPIDIVLNQTYADVFLDEEQTKSALTGIVKHEMLHTLGLKDLENKDEMGQTIMYYAMTNDMDFTDRDKALINYVYGDKTVAISYHPSTLMLCPSKKKFDDIEGNELELN